MQEIIACDANGNSISGLVQWDNNVYIYFSDEGINKAYQVQFFNSTMDEALVVNSVFENNKLKVKIPNDLLVQPYGIAGYINIVKDDESKCIYGFKINVRKKPKPSTIVYVGGEDYISVESIRDECKQLADEIEEYRDDIEAFRGTMESATQSATNAAKLANAAAESATQAAEAINSACILECNYSKSGTVHKLTTENTASENIKFFATADYNRGDTFTFNGTAVTAQTKDGQALGTHYFKANTIVKCSKRENVLYFEGGNAIVDATTGTAYHFGAEDGNIYVETDNIKMPVETFIQGARTLSGSTAYTVGNSVDYPLVGLKVYGKSTQDGTPTPENPVEITSVVEPTVTVCGKNLAEVLNQKWTSNGLTISKSNDGGFTINGCATERTNYRFDQINGAAGNLKKYSKGTYTLSLREKNGNIYNDISRIYGLYLTQYQTWKIILYTHNTTTETTVYDYDNCFLFVTIESGATFDNETFYPQLELSPTATAYEPYKSNTLTLPDTLHGIPVNSGGNVTIDGQEYISDYVDFESGKIHRLIDSGKFDPTVSIVDNLDLLLESEEIIDITETEMQAYRQLATYNGTTNIFNDKGAGISSTYCTNKAMSNCVAPLKSDLQKQIDELKAAVLSLGGNI